MAILSPREMPAPISLVDRGMRSAVVIHLGIRAKFRASGDQTCISNLVNQSSITDLEGHCCSPAVPLIRTQGFENEIALHVADRFPGDALQRNGIRFVGGCLRSRRAPLRRFRDNRGLRPD